VDVVFDGREGEWSMFLVFPFIFIISFCCFRVIRESNSGCLAPDSWWGDSKGWNGDWVRWLLECPRDEVIRSDVRELRDPVTFLDAWRIGRDYRRRLRTSGVQDRGLAVQKRSSEGGLSAEEIERKRRQLEEDVAGSYGH